VRHVFVLSRDHPWSPWLHDYLLERFQHDARVDVVIDRRLSERRALGKQVTRERRRTERRRPLGPDDDLRVRSHYIVEL
jgi:hypothetical protein